MAKKAKGGKSAAVDAVAVPKVAAPVAEVAAPKVAAPEAAKPLTKRNRVPATAMLVQTDKVPKDRAEQNKAAWDVVVAALPATATVLIKALEGAKVPKIVPSIYLSYMIRRGALAEKGE